MDECLLEVAAHLGRVHASRPVVRLRPLGAGIEPRYQHESRRCAFRRRHQGPWHLVFLLRAASRFHQRDDSTLAPSVLQVAGPGPAPCVGETKQVLSAMPAAQRRSSGCTPVRTSSCARGKGPRPRARTDGSGDLFFAAKSSRTNPGPSSRIRRPLGKSALDRCLAPPLSGSSKRPRRRSEGAHLEH